MKPAFHHKLVNGRYGDPCLLVRISRERRALLFDLGDIHALSPSTLGRITDVFISHTHIDHFVGFDALLRATLRRPVPLTLYGPSGITRNVEGRLRGYSWNLIREYPAEIGVVEFNGRFLRKTLFRAETGFGKEALSRAVSDGLLLEDPAFTVRAVVLDHGIPCLAFSLQEPFRINIDKDKLLRRNLTVGPWLTELKRKVLEGRTGGYVVADRKRYAVRDLLDIVRTGRGQKICYATDIGMNRGNLERLVAMAKDADIFFCEAYFMEEDKRLAAERYHLTTRECGRIARRAGAGRLYPIHFSPRYHGRETELIREIEEEFGGSVS